MDVNEKKLQLVSEVSKLSMVHAIGQTGKLNETLVPGMSDVDMFVLCDRIPTREERTNVYEQYKDWYSECMMAVCEGNVWGTGDILLIDRIDVMFMYFTIDEMNSYLDKVLSGKYLWKEGDFYPIGRLSTMKDMSILWEEDNMMSQVKKKVAVYPEELRKKMIEAHRYNILDDESLGRVKLRKDVFFYHQVLENALDHFLQVLFALNDTYFPSRKRTEGYVKEFKIQPENCYMRLMKIIVESVNPDLIDNSVNELVKITGELQELLG